MKRYTNEEFGKLIDCHYSMASRIRSGDRLPSGYRFGLIVKAFGLNAADALDAYNEGSVAFSRYLRVHVPGTHDEIPAETAPVNTDTVKP